MANKKERGLLTDAGKRRFARLAIVDSGGGGDDDKVEGERLVGPGLDLGARGAPEGIVGLDLYRALELVLGPESDLVARVAVE